MKGCCSRTASHAIPAFLLPFHVCHLFKYHCCNAFSSMATCDKHKITFLVFMLMRSGLEYSHKIVGGGGRCPWNPDWRYGLGSREVHHDLLSGRQQAVRSGTRRPPAFGKEFYARPLIKTPLDQHVLMPERALGRR